MNGSEKQIIENCFNYDMPMIEFRSYLLNYALLPCLLKNDNFSYFYAMNLIENSDKIGLLRNYSI